MRTYLRRLLLCLSLRAISAAAAVEPAQVVMLPRSVADVPILAAGSGGGWVALAFRDRDLVRISLLRANDLMESSRITVRGLPHSIAVDRDRLLVAGTREGQGEMCEYPIQAKAEPVCWPLAADPGPVGYALGGRRVIVAQAQIAEAGAAGMKLLASVRAGDQGPVLTAVCPDVVVRLSSTSAVGEVFRFTGELSPVELIHEATAVARRQLQPNRMLLYKLLCHDGEILAARARWAVIDGLPLDRFDSSGRYIGTTYLAIPRLPALVRQPQGAGPSNPMGELVVGYVGSTGESLVIVDFVGRAIASYRVD